MRIATNNSGRVWVPAGTYVLGDPCYAVPYFLWEDAGESSNWFDTPVATVKVEDKTFNILGFSTAHGDGSYYGSDGFDYPVDAGLIGLVPIELANIKRHDLQGSINRIVTFDRDVLCTNICGVMQFGDIVIDTEDCEEKEY